ncbi:hypothetical protein [Bacillus cereus]|uniref:hypothetical protein n=1 Tax=Bacillus cereus TaxID=1396 RepID=UPI002AC29367|nr:hypothetical protein [Bacillus cereus]MDZ4476832.1 hypothetical protein [Bacillus cereus]MDZ4493747.1 hypothetical protein [Bacillus cereus]MDZ4518540.1 hypothetical protein [Bacillus cereus]
MRVVDSNFDYNATALSISTVIELEEYTHLTDYAFNQDGNIDGQRSVISKSAAASKIRDRMIKDFKNGGVFPSVVLGLIVKEEELQTLKESQNLDEDFTHIFNAYPVEDISIIDGMQRTNIYRGCLEGNEDREIRVEYWIATNINKLLYRMLVLNTGQVPWNVRRQVEVIYKPIITTIKALVEKEDAQLYSQLNFFDINDKGRRTNSGEFHKNQIVDLFLVYSLRNEKTDISTQLAEEYKKLDLMESLDQSISLDKFIDIFIAMCKLDLALGKLDLSTVELEGKFTNGKDLFSSNPVRVGFVAAATELIIGRKGRERNTEQSEEALRRLKNNINEIISKLDAEKFSISEIEEFLELQILNQWLTTLSKNNVGEAERTGFKKAFTMIFEEKEGFIKLGEYWMNI